MSKAARVSKTTIAHARTTSYYGRRGCVTFNGYCPGDKDGPFHLGVIIFDRAGRDVGATIKMSSTKTALEILKLAAGLKGLTDEEREELRSITECRPLFGWRVGGNGPGKATKAAGVTATA